MHGSRTSAFALPFLLSCRDIPSGRILQSKRDSSPCKCVSDQGTRKKETKTIITRHEVEQLQRNSSGSESFRRRCTLATTDKSRHKPKTNDGRKTENSLPQENRLSEKRVFHGLTILRTNSCKWTFLTILERLPLYVSLFSMAYFRTI